MASVNGGGTLSNDGASTVYDFDEGIRKHSQHVYGPVLSLLVQQPQTLELLESLEKVGTAKEVMDAVTL